MFTCVTVTVDKLLFTCFRIGDGGKMTRSMKCDREARVGHTLRNVLSLECQQALGMRSCFPFARIFLGAGRPTRLDVSS